MTDPLQNSPASVQAARWFAAQRRKLGTLEERESYRRWAENQANRDALAKLHALWADLGRVQVDEPYCPTARPSFKVMIAIACIATATAGLMWGVEGPFWTCLNWTTR